ncbi:sensor histidine kinase [Halorarius halobius]|uniref:sensor histidine kinase n=1 Tax=Halorarius halobius TaxID=2962671 RepID=UPI0025787AF3|nr:HAMP domain-containing sensor histidine kinase [Halorarius halobius]
MGTQTEGAVADEEWPGRGVAERVAASDLLPSVVLAGVAVALAGFTTYNFLVELSNLRVALPPIIAASQGYVPAFIVAWAAAWLLDSEFDAAGRWRVSLAAVGGTTLFGSVTVLTLFVRWAEGRTVGEARYAVFAIAGAGALAGLLMGVLYARSQRDAEAAASTRDQFELLNSILRHDILNRTMIVRSRAKFIGDNVDGRPAEFADTIVAQSDDISEQVERTRALLDALSGRERDVEPVRLDEAVAVNAETLRTTYEGVDLSVAVPEMEVLADDTLRDVVGNVLSNAVEHNDEETAEIDVTTERHDRYVDLRIADNGPGVDDDLKETIFRRDETGLHEDGTGSGFGLFFVDAMLDAFGGSVWVEDNHPEGAVFVLRFRRPDAGPPA